MDQFPRFQLRTRFLVEPVDVIPSRNDNERLLSSFDFISVVLGRVGEQFTGIGNFVHHSQFFGFLQCLERLALC